MQIPIDQYQSRGSALMPEAERMKPTQIALLDAHKVYRIGLRRILKESQGLQVIGEAETLQEARALIEQTKLNLLLMEVQFEDGNGIEFCQTIFHDYPHLKIVFLTSLNNQAFMESALIEGGSGYLMKDLCPSQILLSLKNCMQGYFVFPSSLLLSIRVKAQAGSSLKGDPTSQILSSFDRQLLSLVVQGKTNKQIGEIFHSSEVTIKKHLSQIYNKLGIARRSQAVSVFLKHHQAEL